MIDFDESRASAAALSRPFFFMVPFWGERYRWYFANILLPSLLSPSNLALLRADQGHRFLIATTIDDWDAIIGLPIIERLRAHATPTLIEIKRPKQATAPGSTGAILHQNIAQKLLVDAAFQARAYGTLFSPDCIISDGMMMSLVRHASAGQCLVLCPALRQSEESATAELTRLGYLSRDLEKSGSGTPICVPPRVLADLMVRHLHPEMDIFQEGARGQPPLAPFRYWRLSRQKGIILHTFHGAPMLMDFGAVDHHDVACLEENSFEDVYVARNFGDKDFHVVEDSDEFCILSLTPAAIGQMTADGMRGSSISFEDGFVRRFLIALSISYHAAQMPLKSLLFGHSIRWHAGDLDDTALDEERKISSLIDRVIRLSVYTRPFGRLLRKYRHAPILASLIPYARALFRALQGDRLLWSYMRQQCLFTISRPFKRAFFRLTSGGYDLDLLDPLHLSFRRTAGRRAVSGVSSSATSRNAVILGLGQSNIANECDPNALYVAKGAVYNFNFFDGKCYAAKDPLLGYSHDRSNLMTRLGDLLVERGNYQSVLLVPIAHGGTFISEWSPAGRMSPRIRATIERLRNQQTRITHILWQQGEAESGASNPDPEEWARHFSAMAGAIRSAGVEAPIYVAQCTMCCNDPNETIRAAQRRVVNPAAGILPGPDIDLIGRDERYDGCHLSGAGLKRAAELWYEALSRPAVVR